MHMLLEKITSSCLKNYPPLWYKLLDYTEPHALAERCILFLK